MFIGGGYILFEFVFIVFVVGREVYIIYYNSEFLKKFDFDFVVVLVIYMKEEGIYFYFDIDIMKVENKGEKLYIYGKDGFLL